MDIDGLSADAQFYNIKSMYLRLQKYITIFLKDGQQLNIPYVAMTSANQCSAARKSANHCYATINNLFYYLTHSRLAGYNGTVNLASKTGTTTTIGYNDKYDKIIYQKLRQTLVSLFHIVLVATYGSERS